MAAPSYFGLKILNPDAFAEPEVSSSKEFIGNVYPDKVYSFGTNFRFWRNLTADILIEHQGGFNLPNYTAYQNSRRGA